jgi:hypothetical protein
MEDGGLNFKLTKQVLYSWATPPVHFALGILERGGLKNYLPRLASDLGPPNVILPNS